MVKTYLVIYLMGEVFKSIVTPSPAECWKAITPMRQSVFELIDKGELTLNNKSIDKEEVRVSCEPRVSEPISQYYKE